MTLTRVGDRRRCLRTRLRWDCFRSGRWVLWRAIAALMPCCCMNCSAGAMRSEEESRPVDDGDRSAIAMPPEI